MSTKKLAPNILQFPGNPLVTTEFPDDDDEDSLEDAIDESDLSIDIDEVEAFICDALYRKQPARSGFDRIIEGLGEYRFAQASIERLIRMGYDFADEISSTYRRADEIPAYAELRSELVDIYAGFLVWMRKLETHLKRPKDIQTAAFAELSELVSGVCATLPIINDLVTGEYDAESKKELNAFKKSLPNLKTQITGLMEAVERHVKRPQAAKARRATTRKAILKRPAALKRYVIHTSITGIEPEISRWLVVPGNRTLGELHTIIQHAFGWSDNHLHLFRLRGENYGEPSSEDIETILDEKNFRLDELRLRGRSRIEYMYDFGDEWLLELLIKTSLPVRAGEPDIPICMDSSRASPPEDCGGIYGYEDALAVLKKKKRDLDEDDKDFLTWLGTWDPEQCDLDAINNAISTD